MLEGIVKETECDVEPLKILIFFGKRCIGGL